MFRVPSVLVCFAMVLCSRSEDTEPQDAPLLPLQDMFVGAATSLNESCGEPCLEVLRNLTDSAEPFGEDVSRVHTLLLHLGSAGMQQVRR